ncbi:MAG: dTDP-4-dehydrorhamnose reductase [Phycisphaerae bacterium]|nr:dTDP-4-dehydrorhamnose reductase [Phycisphaerae bacterium]
MALEQPIAVLGAGGMLGRAVVRRLESEGVRTLAVGRDTIDLAGRIPETVITDLGAAAVVNCAAWTDVDGAEAAEDEATAVNGEGVARLTKACAVGGATLVHFSTDYVFDGLSTTPYTTGHPRAPLNAYGRSKAVGERALEESDADWICVRTSWLYGAWGKNFVLTIARLLAERDELKVVSDQVGRPSSVRQLADRSLALLARGERGMFHSTDGGECSWHGFAKFIAGVTRSNARVEPCGTDAFPRPAKRPPYSVLDTSATDEALGDPAHWHEETRAALRDATEATEDRQA